MQTQKSFLDDLAKVASGALSAMTGVKGEAEALLRQKIDRVFANMDLVTREEFEAVKAMAAKARAEQEDLAARLKALEAELSKCKPQAVQKLQAAVKSTGAAKKAPAKKAAARKAPAKKAPAKKAPAKKAAPARRSVSGTGAARKAPAKKAPAKKAPAKKAAPARRPVSGTRAKKG